nr:hypothetical protein [Oryza sativa Japonica Group]
MLREKQDPKTKPSRISTRRSFQECEQRHKPLSTPAQNGFSPRWERVHKATPPRRNRHPQTSILPILEEHAGLEQKLSHHGGKHTAPTSAPQQAQKATVHVKHR